MRSRYVFEHIMLPYLLDRRGYDMISLLLIRKQKLIRQLISSAYEQNGEDMPYTEDDFGLEAYRLDEKTVCVTVIMPKPEQLGDCEKIFILSDEKPFKASYFTAEKGEDGDTLLCCQADDIRLIFGKFEDEKKALALMLGVHHDNNKED